MGARTHLDADGHPCPFYRGDGLCIATEEERASVNVAVRKLIGASTNGDVIEATETLQQSVDDGIARIEETPSYGDVWPGIPPLNDAGA